MGTAPLPMTTPVCSEVPDATFVSAHAASNCTPADSDALPILTDCDAAANCSRSDVNTSIPVAEAGRRAAGTGRTGGSRLG